jgi:hypothetical protein
MRLPAKGITAVVLEGYAAGLRLGTSSRSGGSAERAVAGAALGTALGTGLGATSAIYRVSKPHGMWARQGLNLDPYVMPGFYDGWPPGYHKPPGNPETQGPPSG